MDKHWYHRLLIGSVLEGAELERKLTDLGVPISLGANISARSPLIRFGRRLRSDQKLDLFYLVLATMGVIAAGGSFGTLWLCLFVIVMILVWWNWWSAVPLADGLQPP
jgi:hypothetical protein